MYQYDPGALAVRVARVADGIRSVRGAIWMNGTLWVPEGASPGSESKSMNHLDSRFWTCQSRAGPEAIRPNRSSIDGGGVGVGSEFGGINVAGACGGVGAVTGVFVAVATGVWPVVETSDGTEVPMGVGTDRAVAVDELTGSGAGIPRTDVLGTGDGGTCVLA